MQSDQPVKVEEGLLQAVLDVAARKADAQLADEAWSLLTTSLALPNPPAPVAVEQLQAQAGAASVRPSSPEVLGDAKSGDVVTSDARPSTSEAGSETQTSTAAPEAGQKTPQAGDGPRLGVRAHALPAAYRAVIHARAAVGDFQ